MDNRDFVEVWIILIKIIVGAFVLASVVGGCMYLDNIYRFKDEDVIQDIFESVIETQLGLPPETFNLDLEYE